MGDTVGLCGLELLRRIGSTENNKRQTPSAKINKLKVDTSRIVNIVLKTQLSRACLFQEIKGHFHPGHDLLIPPCTIYSTPYICTRSKEPGQPSSTVQSKFGQRSSQTVNASRFFQGKCSASESRTRQPWPNATVAVGGQSHTAIHRPR